MLTILKWPLRQLTRMLIFLVGEPAGDKCLCYHCDPHICELLEYPVGCMCPDNKRRWWVTSNCEMQCHLTRPACPEEVRRGIQKS